MIPNTPHVYTSASGAGQVEPRPTREESVPYPSIDISPEHIRYLALVTDYDGTIATDGTAPAAVMAALRRLAGSGRHAILATGRRLQDLLEVCPDVGVFSYVVAENGAVVYRSQASRNNTLGGAFAKGVPDSFGERRRGSTRNRIRDRFLPSDPPGEGVKRYTSIRPRVENRIQQKCNDDSTNWNQ